MIKYYHPWCLHKHGETWEITRFMDVMLVFLCPCGGIRTEAREEPS